METAAIRALILSLCAGMSTLLGALVVMVIKKSEKLVSISLGFAAGIMISVSLTDLYPNAVDSISQNNGQQGGILLTVVGMLFGMLLAGMLDRFVPHQAYDRQTGESPHKNLFHVGFVLFYRPFVRVSTSFFPELPRLLILFIHFFNVGFFTLCVSKPYKTIPGKLL